MAANHKDPSPADESPCFGMRVSLRQSRTTTPRVRLWAVDVDPGLIELCAGVMELAADRLDISIENDRRELIAPHRYRCQGLPLRGSFRPLIQVERPMVNGVGIPIRLDATYVM